MVPQGGSSSRIPTPAPDAAGAHHRPPRGLAAGGRRLRRVPGLRPRAAAVAATASPGPAIVEQMDATTLVLPGMTARVDPYLNLILEMTAD